LSFELRRKMNIQYPSKDLVFVGAQYIVPSSLLLTAFACSL
jgi:hypothetical protein